MTFISFDPITFSMAGIALMLSLVALLIVVYYVRKLAAATALMAANFHRVLDAYGFFDELDGEFDSDDDGDSDDGPEGPTSPVGNAYATTPLPEVHPEPVSDSEAAVDDATLVAALLGPVSITKLADDEPVCV